MVNQDVLRVITGEVRLSYVHAFKPYAKQPNQEPKFSVTILVPKTDVATKQKIDAAVQAAIQEGVSSKWNGVRPPVIAIPVHDGDGARPSDGMPFGDECKGHWVFTASSKEQPQVVDAYVQPILNQSEVYSGIYGRVSVRFFPYNQNGKKGVGCGLGNIQKLRDGDPLSGRTSASSDFGEFGTPPQQPAWGFPQQPPQPAAPAYPQQPAYPQAPQGYGQPQYQPPAPQGYAPPQYPQAAPPAPQQQTAQQQIDPITGAPVVPGGVYGVDTLPF
ncbi:uncharacterized protein DUF2815 [Heliophilum fasciatum]|uniref:Uncharacterized protein DUF2815 n=2 Tax=Heliophilum fasciatum TaxID=35700 RepID=A0A4R2RLE9_9FIRM|nr:DUF2815 family protein [Heliophilum fasciatum]TCP64750.1 uncharacterized protein DUF2815 [Heliophilum fasciatum]